MQFYCRHAGTADPGRYVRIKGNEYNAYSKPPRGHCVVMDEGYAYFYRVKQGEKRTFRQWVEATYPGRRSFTCKLVGAWPYYETRRA